MVGALIEGLERPDLQGCSPSWVVWLVLLLVGPLCLPQPLRENSGLFPAYGGLARCMRPGRLAEERAEMTSDPRQRQCPSVNEECAWDSQRSLQLLSVRTTNDYSLFSLKGSLHVVQSSLVMEKIIFCPLSLHSKPKLTNRKDTSWGPSHHKP